MRRSSRNTTLPGTTLVLVPPLDAPDVEIRMGDARHLGRDRLVAAAFARRAPAGSAPRLQRVDAGVGDGRMGHPAVDRDFELQAAVVRGDDRVAEAGGDHSRAG